MKILNINLIVSSVVLILSTSVCHAKAVSKKAAPVSRAQIVNKRVPASLTNGISDSQKTLEIRGQTRNLAMSLVLKNRHENIDFVKPRENYQSEIKNTGY